jgi:hypothetical protein
MGTASGKINRRLQNSSTDLLDKRHAEILCKEKPRGKPAGFLTASPFKRSYVPADLITRFTTAMTATTNSTVKMMPPMI